METFAQSQLEAIAQALGDTSQGLTGAEIGLLLGSARLTDTDPTSTKWKRLYNAFADSQNSLGHRRNVLAFIRFAMKPARYVRYPERYEPLRMSVNRALCFSGIVVEESGELVKAR